MKTKAKTKTKTESKAKSRERCLLATMTKEPFQPVRLYYTIPDKSHVVRKLKKMKCMVEKPSEGCWHWLYHAEAASLQFTAGGYDDVPVDRRPIILGRIRFPKLNSMTIETNSFDRAIVGAKFFAGRFGADVTAIRCRLVNRFFAADEDVRLGKLMAALDRDVIVIDPREAEADLRREFKGVRSPEDVNRASAEFINRRIKDKDDVPLVEDFPLAPEEETPDFRHLSTTLRFRFVRAAEHWRGNTHLTLASIIVEAVKQAGHDLNKSAGRDVSGKKTPGKKRMQKESGCKAVSKENPSTAKSTTDKKASSKNTTRRKKTSGKKT